LQIRLNIMNETQTLEIVDLLQTLPDEKVAEVRNFVVSLQKDNARKPAILLSKIAALPNENDEKKFNGRDHDEILYGKK
jgi:hypothetical protein